MFGLKNINIHSIGIALSATGIPLSMYLNQFCPITKWTSIVFILSTILIINWKNAFRLRFISKNKIYNWIIIFQVIMLVYGFNSERMTNQFLSFHLYILALCFALMTLSFEDISNKVVEYIYLLSFPCIILGLIVCQLHWVTGEIAWSLREYSEIFFIEPFTVATGAMVNIFAAYCVLRKSIVFKIFSLISIVVGFYILFECGKRTPVIITLMGYMYFLYCKRVLLINMLYKNNKYLIILAVLIVVVYIVIPDFADRVDMMLKNTVTGIANILGDTSVSDSSGSAIERYRYRQQTYKYVNTHFSLINYIVGGGYFIMWIDNPLLEAYLDMGILGAFMYFMIVLYFPFKIIRRRINNDFIIFFGCMALYSILSVFSSGHPYMAIKYIPVCFLAFSSKWLIRKS